MNEAVDVVRGSHSESRERGLSQQKKCKKNLGVQVESEQIGRGLPCAAREKCVGGQVSFKNSQRAPIGAKSKTGGPVSSIFLSFCLGLETELLLPLALVRTSLLFILCRPLDGRASVHGPTF